MKTLLYATDYSKNSVTALQFAYNLSQALGMRLVITHTFNFPTVLGVEGLDERPILDGNPVKIHRAQLEKFCTEHLGSKWDNPKIQLEPVLNSSVIKGIISKAEDYHAQLIVVGTKGASGLEEMILGSTTKKLIEKAPCPVIAIPHDVLRRNLDTMVYATDFEEEDIHAIQKLSEIARPLKAKIKVVHISTQEEYAGDLLMEWFKDMLKSKVNYPDIEFELLFSEDVFDTLRIYLGVVNADMVVMLEREKKGFLKKWFHRDLVKKMEDYGEVILMSFNEHNHKTLFF
ncbi:nucleotide-binding universal stress UspA family protein [Arenibacter algicola]|mgnify:FL=1|jgi:nucleotide-binding universal stress UspA family protein|uniref:Nucleotide-binding universal stress UspA family protein n=1 Tax=Arenibacter algicola TaxID=616991 RepID=A0A221V073_9FLAO|nr:universal stress protein [Arenibacter algicola]ASO06984.1 universal stress protein UspE [Arenibacter algicola]|tara:strand:+ start:1460 stop:2320 length:861 start_codon:yes stop_codon:yes gene_type:complete